VLRLVEPDPSLRESYVEAVLEMRAEGDASPFELVVPAGPGSPALDFTAERLRDPDTFERFCAWTRDQERPDAERPAGWVAGTYRWMVTGAGGPGAGERFVGRISLRHVLTPWLLEVGGHVGYAVRPSARRQGHATRALALLLPLAAARGIDRVLVTCDLDNVGSRAVIEANGGVLEDRRGEKLRYWVPTA
jgi:predicted acetyltransferase